jgi:hypothetical protein
MFHELPRGSGCSSSQATLYCARFPNYVSCDQHRELLIGKYNELLSHRVAAEKIRRKKRFERQRKKWNRMERNQK